MRGPRSIAAFAAASLIAATLVATPGGAADLSVTVTPVADLIDGQVVHVAISGATPGNFGYAQLCAADGASARCAFGGSGGGVADDQGAMAFDMGLDAVFVLFDRSTVDCRVAPGCVLDTIVSNEDGTATQAVRTVLAFRPDGPLLPPPTITVTPSTDLVDGTTVHVTGQGFKPGSGIEIVSCQAPFTEYGDCESPRAYEQSGTDGSLTADLYLPAILATGNGEQVDCRAVACELVATRNLFQADERHTARAALAFRADGPLRPPPTLTVEPADGLVDGQEVQISGTGFRPGFVYIAQCGGPGPVYQRCSGVGDGGVVADATGAVTGTVQVKVLARVGTGFVDCRKPPGCTIEALDFNSAEALAAVPVTFDPEGPAPTFPTLTVAPNGPLATRSGAIVSGTGFSPHTGIYLEECRLEDGLPQECSGLGSSFVETDAQGAFVAGTLVTAVIAGPDGSEIDCRKVTCGVVADSFDAYPGVGALDFGPPVASAGRYLAPVFDSVELTEGIVYRSTTNSRGAAVDLKLDVYRPAGDTETKRPAVMWMFGGYFGSGDRVQLREMAQAMARRGYVSISIDYRTRPEIFSGENGCVSVGGTCLDPTQIGPAITDARDDARAAMVWLHEHAAEYGIEPRAISSAGWSAGAITSLNLAHDDTGERPTDSIPAAAISLAGILATTPHAGDPPSLMMGGNHDTLLPLGAQIGGCSSILVAGSSCEFVAYAGQRPAPEADECVTWTVSCTYVVGRDGEHGWFFSDRPDVIDHISAFLAEQVLKPLDLLPHPPKPEPPRHHHPHHHPHHDHHDRDHHDRDHDDHDRHGHRYGNRW